MALLFLLRGLTISVTLLHWRYQKCQNANHSSNRFSPSPEQAPDDNHHALMAKYRVSESLGKVAFLYCLHNKRC